MDWTIVTPILALLGFIGTGIATVIKVTWVVKDGIDSNKADFTNRLDLLKKSHEDKHSRIYERFDEYKVHIEKDILGDYVRKDLWSLRNEGLEKSIHEVHQHMLLQDEKLDDLKDILVDIRSNGNGK